MHTYRKVGRNVWQVVFQEQPVGPEWDEEFEAAAFACFLNGGRYSPNEIEPIFPKEYPAATDDDTTYPRPKDMDYEPEPARK